MKKKKLSTLSQKSQNSKDRMLSLDSTGQLNRVPPGWITKIAYNNVLNRKLVITCNVDGVDTSNHIIFDVILNRYTDGDPVKITIAAYMGPTNTPNTQSFSTSNLNYTPTITKDLATRTLTIEIPLSRFAMIYVTKSVDITNSANEYNSDFSISIEDV